MRTFVLAFCLLAGAASAAQPVAPCRDSSPEEQHLDAAAFEGFDQAIAGQLTDIQSVVVVLQGRVAYQYYRDGNPEALRDTQSVAKSALSTLVGIALRQGHVASLDRPVVELVPEWRRLNADPRAQSITLHHLLAMTAGFEVSDAAGTAAPLAPEQAWARALRREPGQSFAYDNSTVNLVTAILEKLTARALGDYAREQLVEQLGMIEPSYERGLHLRTVDMAKLGHLFLQGGVWNGQPLLPAAFVLQAIKAQSDGGPPVRLPYGLSWWVPSGSTYFASGYGGQFVWVHAPLGLVFAITSTVSAESQQRVQAIQLIRGPLFKAAQKRVAAGER
jgi:CubicO group peptidase (beta-lactamase class C family)